MNMERLDGGETIWLFDLERKLFVDLPAHAEHMHSWATWTPYESVSFTLYGFVIKTKDKTIRVVIKP